jgi:hypothetical protein
VNTFFEGGLIGAAFYTPRRAQPLPRPADIPGGGMALERPDRVSRRQTTWARHLTAAPRSTGETHGDPNGADAVSPSGRCLLSSAICTVSPGWFASLPLISVARRVLTLPVSSGRQEKPPFNLKTSAVARLLQWVVRLYLYASLRCRITVISTMRSSSSMV